MTPFDAAIELMEFLRDHGKMGGEPCPDGFNGWKCRSEFVHKDFTCDFADCLRAYCEWRAKEGEK